MCNKRILLFLFVSTSVWYSATQTDQESKSTYNPNKPLLYFIAIITTIIALCYSYQRGKVQRQHWNDAPYKQHVDQHAHKNIYQPDYQRWLVYITIVSLALPVILFVVQKLGDKFISPGLYLTYLKRLVETDNYFDSIIGIILSAFTHGDLYHLIGNIYWTCNIAISIKNNLYAVHPIWNSQALVSMIFGAIASVAVALTISPGIGLSGGVYAIKGYYYVSGQMKDYRLTMWLVPYSVKAFTFTLPAFIEWYVLPVESVLGLSTLFVNHRVALGNVGHLGHIGGFFFGIAMYYCYREGLNAGYMKHKLSGNIDAVMLAFRHFGRTMFGLVFYYFRRFIDCVSLLLPDRLRSMFSLIIADLSLLLPGRLVKENNLVNDHIDVETTPDGKNLVRARRLNAIERRQRTTFIN